MIIDPRKFVPIEMVLEATRLSTSEKRQAVDKQLHVVVRYLSIYHNGVTRGVQNKANQVFNHQGLSESCGIAMQVYLNAWLQVFSAVHCRKDLGFDFNYHRLAASYFLFDEWSISKVARAHTIGIQRAHEMFFGRSHNSDWPHGRPGIYDYIIAAERLITDRHGRMIVVNTGQGQENQEFEPRMDTD